MLKRLTLIALGLTSMAAAATYGTQFTPATYDQLAAKYQTPGLIQPTFKYGDDSGIDSASITTFPALSTTAYWKSGDQKLSWFPNHKAAEAAGYNYSHPVTRSTCTLLSAAALADRIMRNSVIDLENLIGNSALKTLVLSVAGENNLYLEYSTAESSLEGKTKAVAVAGATRVPAAEVLVTDRSSSTSQYGTTYTIFHRAKFRIDDLEKAGAIQGNKITFQKGWQQKDLCTFDLSQLP